MGFQNTPKRKRGENIDTKIFESIVSLPFPRAATYPGRKDVKNNLARRAFSATR